MTETACSLFSWEHIYNNMCSTSYICEDIIFKFQCIEITIVKKTHFDFSLKYLCSSKGFQGGLSGKESSCQFKRPWFDPGLGRSLEEEMEPTLVSLPEKFHGKRSLVGYSPWGGRVRHH